jgi:phosphate transport system protein
MPNGYRTEEHDRAISTLKQHVAAMTDLSVGMVADGTRALLNTDPALSQSVIDRDPLLDKFDLDIEAETIRLIATLQPEGADLRTLGAVLKIANCVDRVGRLGYDLARNISAAPEGSDGRPKELLSRMDERARSMVRLAIDSFVRNDAPLAKSVLVLDDEVDALNRQVQQALIDLLREGGPNTDRLAHELLAARHLERVADNACKIAEKAVYAITGERRSEYFQRVVHPAGANPP